MKLFRLALLALLPLTLAAADADARLEQFRRQYPDADANRDGTLTAEEARAYANQVKSKKKSRPRSAMDDEDAGQARPDARRPAPSHADVAYGPHPRNTLDLWLAKSDTPTPLVVYIHGGGFVNGSKAGANADMIRGCLEAGVSFMAINYRFRDTAPIQDILRDCARSIQFARYKAAHYNIDPRRIAAYGGSAGAGTSLWLAFHPDLADPGSSDPVLRQSSRILAAGALNTQATYNLRRWPAVIGKVSQGYERAGEVPAFYGARSDAELNSAKYQPILDDVDMLKLISHDDAPVFMYTSHPDGDVTDRGHLLHHPSHARAVKTACDAAGVPATVFFARAEPRMNGDHLGALRDFLLRHLETAAAAQ